MAGWKFHNLSVQNMPKDIQLHWELSFKLSPKTSQILQFSIHACHLTHDFGHYIIVMVFLYLLYSHRPPLPRIKVADEGLGFVFDGSGVHLRTMRISITTPLGTRASCAADPSCHSPMTPSRHQYVFWWLPHTTWPYKSYQWNISKSTKKLRCSSPLKRMWIPINLCGPATCANEGGLIEKGAPELLLRAVCEKLNFPSPMKI